MSEIESRTIELATNDKHKKLSFEPVFFVNGFFTFTIVSQSVGFSGKSSFCCAAEAIVKFVGQVDEISQRLTGVAKLSDNDSDAFVELASINYGKVQVNSFVEGSHRAQFARVFFETDQTALEPLSQGLVKLVKAYAV